MEYSLEQFKTAITTNNIVTVREALQQSQIHNKINDGIFPYKRIPLLEAPSLEMVDTLIGAGATIDKVSNFWASGFWLANIPTNISRYLILKGATLTIHAAAALGLTDEVKKFLDENPDQANVFGGDSGTPLHFARNTDIAKLLIDRGANLNARDKDHFSTAAQWHIKFAPEITRLLLHRGAESDIFLAVALGDIELTRKALAANPNCVAYRIGNNKGPYPGIGFEGRGGTILQWRLGFNLAPQEIAIKHGHLDIYNLLMQTTPPKHKLQIACMIADRNLAMSLLESHPKLIEEFDEEDLMLLAKACWETNNDTKAITLMIECGFPLGIPEHNHCYSPLHNAAWCGNSEIVRLLLKHGHPIDLIDPQHNSSAVDCAIFSATVGRCYPDVDYAGVVEALIQAGLDSCVSRYPTGHKAIDVVLKKYIEK